MTLVRCIASGIEVARVTAADSDTSSPNKDVFYLIASGGNDQFQINSTSGQITTVVRLDREKNSNYNLTVLAVDRGSPARTATTTVSVTVDNVNDDPPLFSSPRLSLSFKETATHGRTIVRNEAVDGDDDAHLVYSINWSNSTGLDENQQPVSTSVLQVNKKNSCESKMRFSHRLAVQRFGKDSQVINFVQISSKERRWHELPIAPNVWQRVWHRHTNYSEQKAVSIGQTQM